MNDDFDDNDLDLDDASFDEFEQKEGKLGELLKNPFVKIGLVVLAIIIVFFVISSFSSNTTEVGQSVVAQGSDITAPPGTEAASQEYIDAVQEVNERNVEVAQATGTSALPTPIEPPVGVLTVPEETVQTEDPLQRWRRLQEERLERELQQAQTIEPTVAVDDTARQESIQRLAEAMSAQMTAVLDSQSNSISYQVITNPESLNEASESQVNVQQIDDGELTEEVIQETLLLAGEIEYGQLLIEANSDVPGPVLAQIMTGPLKGGRLLGNFTPQDDVLTLNFTTLVFNDDTLSVNAIALDPSTTLPGVASHVDKRYLQRIVFPAAAAFLTGIAEAIAESGTTTVTVEGETVTQESEDIDTDQELAAGLTAASESLEEIIDEEVGDIQPLIRIETGTPMGILFLNSVVTQDETL